MKKGIILVIYFICLFLFLSKIVSSEINASLKYEKKYPSAFKGRLEASGLKPNHVYVLTLNGYVGHSSNNILKKECEEYKPTGEGYCDFDEVNSDNNGSLSVDIEEELPPAKYKVKFLIKDKNTWGVIWNKDIVKFEVEKPTNK